MNAIEKRIAETIAIHFDAKWGAPYWLRRKASLGFDPVKEIRGVEDLQRFGVMPIDDLAKLPVTDLLPKRYHDSLHTCVTSETGGTTGPPKRTVFLDSEFEEAFVIPFVEAAKLMRFPKNCNWLFVGPSGPHIIGKAARACAKALGSIDPFTVDFDPRWVRKLAVDSFARQRYLAHVLDQALAILRVEPIGVLFSTPPVLQSLATQLDRSIRDLIVGIHLGGMAAEPAFWEAIDQEWFPNAVVMGGYGNSLFGMCPQLTTTVDAAPVYFPHGSRVVIEVDAKHGDERGALRVHRLDQSAFLPNVIERDEASLAPASDKGKNLGFTQPGIRDPRPSPSAKDASGGLY